MDSHVIKQATYASCHFDFPVAENGLRRQTENLSDHALSGRHVLPLLDLVGVGVLKTVIVALNLDCENGHLKGKGRGLSNHAFHYRHAHSQYCRNRRPKNSACEKRNITLMLIVDTNYMQGEGWSVTNHATTRRHALSQYCRSWRHQNSTCKNEI